jgi:hypothetical protein
MKMKLNRHYFMLGTGLIFFIYIIIRAFTLSFTHDESLSYSLIIGDKTFTDTANNHILNTYLMQLCGILFGYSEFSLRLPNVSAFILYFLGGFLILKESKNIWLTLLGSSLMLFNPFLIDFFSLARGYGLSLGFMMMSLFFLLKRNLHYLSYSLLITDFICTMAFAFAALFANISTIAYFIALLIIFIFQYLFLVIRKPIKSFLPHFMFAGITLMTFVPIYFVAERFLLLNVKNELYFGEMTLTGTINSLLKQSIYFSHPPSWILMVMRYTLMICLASGIVWIIFKNDFSVNFLKMTILIVVVLTGLFLSHYLFNSKYPSGRAALFLIPVYGFFIFYFSSQIIQSIDLKRQPFMSVLLCFPVTLPLLLHFIISLNLLKTHNWYFDAHTKDVMKIVEKYAHNSDRNLSISNHWLFEPSINYYISSRKMKVNPTNRSGVDRSTDFVYEFDENNSLENFKPLIKFPDIGTTLLIKEKHP